jgi:uncharacterized protein (TIGR03083 family)
LEQNQVVDIEAYLAVRERLTETVAHTDGKAWVPTCPDWRVRDVVAHLAGLCEDWVCHRLDGYASASWTAAQVARFSGCSLSEILDRWEAASTSFAALDNDAIMGPPARWAFGDAVTHEADVRGAIGAGPVPHDAVLLGLKGSVARWRHLLAEAGAPTLLLRASDGRDWWLGVPDDPEVVVVEAPTYEVFRGLTGRRSQDQLRAWSWSGDASQYLDIGLPYPFRWAEADIKEDVS